MEIHHHINKIDTGSYVHEDFSCLSWMSDVRLRISYLSWNEEHDMEFKNQVADGISSFDLDFAVSTKISLPPNICKNKTIYSSEKWIVTLSRIILMNMLDRQSAKSYKNEEPNIIYIINTSYYAHSSRMVLELNAWRD